MFIKNNIGLGSKKTLSRCDGRRKVLSIDTHFTILNVVCAWRAINNLTRSLCHLDACLLNKMKKIFYFHFLWWYFKAELGIWEDIYDFFYEF